MAAQKLPRLKSVTPDIDPSDIQFEKNDILGTGGYGAVYKGKYKGDVVAIKSAFVKEAEKPAPHVIKMIRNESLIMCSLNHPNMLRVFGTVLEKGWIVMELCEGGALDEMLLDSEREVSAQTKLRISAEIATGVAYMHMPENAIVHGDLKSGNVLLTKDKSVRICDFGMSEAKNRSKVMTAAMGGSKQTGIAVTVPWSAPELFKDKPKSFASDVYALAVTIWEIYERRIPFGNMPEAAVVNQVLAGTRPEITVKDMPPMVKKIIEESPTPESISEHSAH